MDHDQRLIAIRRSERESAAAIQADLGGAVSTVGSEAALDAAWVSATPLGAASDIGRFSDEPRRRWVCVSEGAAMSLPSCTSARCGVLRRLPWLSNQAGRLKPRREERHPKGVAAPGLPRLGSTYIGRPAAARCVDKWYRPTLAQSHNATKIEPKHNVA